VTSNRVVASERYANEPLPRERIHVTSVAGTYIAWTEQGSGEALVLLHGIGDSKRTWRCIAPILARHYRVLMPDLPGHGLSGRPDAPYTLAWFAQVVDEWMTAIGVVHAHMAGHSFGGGLAQWILLDHRERVDRLVLIATGGLGREVGFGLRLASLPFLELFCTPAAMWLGTSLGMLMIRRTYGNPLLPEMREIARLNGIPGTGRTFCRTIRGVINALGQSVQTRGGVESVTTLPPIALFWGSDDHIIPVDHGRRAVALFHGSTLRVFPGCGHFPHLQEPAQVASEMLAFLGADSSDPR
jgi:pimeloyl-ACP methyl ester carboxylesterase